jgi:hypothetical protein
MLTARVHFRFITHKRNDGSPEEILPQGRIYRSHFNKDDSLSKETMEINMVSKLFSTFDILKVKRIHLIILQKTH